MNCRSYFIAFLALVIFAGCSAGSKVRHLSSDVCLVVPENTTRPEVVSFLGQPDNRSINAEKQEVWSYVTVRRSFLRKAPLLGKFMGSEQYEIVTVTFAGDQVRTCFYRNMSYDQFREFSSENGQLQVEE